MASYVFWHFLTIPYNMRGKTKKIKNKMNLYHKNEEMFPDDMRLLPNKRAGLLSYLSTDKWTCGKQSVCWLWPLMSCYAKRILLLLFIFSMPIIYQVISSLFIGKSDLLFLFPWYQFCILFSTTFLSFIYKY